MNETKQWQTKIKLKVKTNKWTLSQSLYIVIRKFMTVCVHLLIELKSQETYKD